MSKADELKVLVAELRSAAYLVGNTAKEQGKLFAAIDAQQSIIDEQWAEIERLKTPAPVCPVCGSDCNERDELVKAERDIERLRKDAEQLRESLGMFVARLENMQKNGDKWLTVVAVLALLNNCQYLAHLSAAAGSQTELTPTDVCGTK